MSETVTAIPTFGFARGAIVRKTSGGPNMLVVRDLAETVCVVRCEGDEAGTLRLREEPKHDLVQVLDHDGRSQLAAEIASLRAQLDEAKEAVKFASESVAGLARTAADLRSELDEARRKAIEQCAAIAKTYGGDCDLMISEFRALLSESKS